MEETYKAYRIEKKKNPIFAIISIAIFVFYFIMLTSGGWMPKGDGGYETTKYLTELKNEQVQRTLMLIRWEYSEEQKKMQVQFRIKNESYDAQNEYDFSAVDRNLGKLHTEAAYQDPEILVVNISDVPEKWSTVSLRMALKGTSPDEAFLFKIYGNRDSIKTVDRIEERGKNGYYILDTKANITVLEKEIRNQEKMIQENRNKIQEIINAVSKKTADLTYMTAQEKEEANEEISSLNGTADSYRQDITACEDLIKEYQERIGKLKEKIKNIEE